MSGSPINPNSITRWLTSILIAAVVLVVVLVGGGIYWYNVSSNEQAFVAKIDGTLTNLRDALSKPLWNIDNPGVKQLGDAMLQSDLVVSVVVRDDGGKSIFSASNDSSEETVLRTIPIHYRQAVVGELQLKFSREPLYRENQRDLMVLAAWGGILLLFGLWIWRLNTEMKLRKRIEKELLRSKKKAETANQAKSTFLANMSHELRTPLNAILGFSKLMSHETGTTPEQQTNLGIINRSGEHLLNMINDVLDLSKIEAGYVELVTETFNLPQMLEDIGNMFKVRAQSTGLHFELQLDPALPQYIKTDGNKLRQILINLLGNAAKYTSQGSLFLRAQTQPIEGNSGLCKLYLEVEDSGQGIGVEQMQSIFDPFVQVSQIQTNTNGTGLGLTITKSFVELLGGKISVESKLGEGSLFRVELPVALGESNGSNINISKTSLAVLGLESEQPTWRILVVEDNTENRLLLCNLLTKVGFDIREAANGDEAVKQFTQWQPHFIWMDMRMPIMDGYEATRRIRALPGGDAVKIVALTASAFKEQSAKVMEAGCDDFVAKPSQPEAIFDCMARYLDVHYIYEQEEKIEEQQVAIQITPEMLFTLPDDSMAELQNSVKAHDMEQTFAVLDSLSGELDPELINVLRQLVEDMNFKQLKNILGLANGRNTDKHGS